jgi:glucan 1,3-beta-glucosidase
LKRHWDTWCTFADFKRIKDAGFNTVRIPIGYWAYRRITSDPYIAGAAPYIDAAVDWARILNLKIWIDLHGAPGGQNGFDNSGQKGSLRWQTGENEAQTLQVLRDIASKYGKPSHADVISGIELLNEPVGPGLDVNKIKKFYRDGYNLVRTFGNAPVVIHDAFLEGWKWNGILSPIDRNAQRVIVDHHEYQVFDNGKVRLSSQQHRDLACERGKELMKTDKWAVVGEWSGAMTDCAKWLNGFGTGSRYEGTFNGSPRAGSCVNKNDIGRWTPQMKREYRAFIEAQIESYERHSQGWIFWNFKTEGAAEWDAFRLLGAGVFPQPLTQRLYPRCPA